MSYDKTSENSGWVRRVSLAPPGPGDNTADFERIAAALAGGFDTRPITCGLQVLEGLSRTLRENGFAAKAVLFPSGAGIELVAVLPPEDIQPAMGLAVDLGTTRIVMSLIDLETGRELAETSFDNPQIPAGPDVLARVHFAESPEGMESLQQSVSKAICAHAADLARKAGSHSSRIFCAAMAGNTVMTHLFLGLPPRNLIREPYIPVVNRPGTFEAGALGLDLAENARIFVFPNVGSYFGGDLVSGILATGIHESKKPVMMADVGTNAEVIVGCADWMVGCAGAAGPALEGGVSKMGSVAAPGAIEYVDFDPVTKNLAYRTIGGLPPTGICGSGVIDLAAALFLTGRIDLRGKFVLGVCGENLVEQNGVPAYLLVPAEESGTGRALCFTQPDVDSLTRSKAAMYTILATIMRTVGLQFSDLESFLVAGTFGSNIRPVSAIAIGMIPDLPLSVYRAAGNTSLEGAALALSSERAMRLVNDVARKITYIELNVNQEFMNRFSAAKFYPHTDMSRFPSVSARLSR